MGLMILLILAGYPIMSYIAITKGIKVHIKELGVIWALYPDKYIVPSRSIRKQFKLEKKEILKFYYYQLYIANGCLLWYIFILLLLLLSDLNFNLTFNINVFIFFLVFVDIIIIEAKTSFYRKLAKNNSRQ